MYYGLGVSLQSKTLHRDIFLSREPYMTAQGRQGDSLGGTDVRTPLSCQLVNTSTFLNWVCTPFLHKFIDLLSSENCQKQSVNKEYLSQIHFYSIFSELPALSNTVLIIT